MNLYGDLCKAVCPGLPDGAFDDTILKGIPDFLDEVEPLFPDIRTEIRIVDRCTGKEKIGGLCNVKAPYYAVLYSEPKEKSDMNAGFSHGTAVPVSGDQRHRKLFCGNGKAPG